MNHALLVQRGFVFPQAGYDVFTVHDFAFRLPHQFMRRGKLSAEKIGP
jgi:hypothetical protein